MRNNYIKIIALLIIAPLILCGCWDKKLIEDIGFITLMGIDSSTEGNLKVTYAMPVVDPDKKARGEIIETTGHLLRECRNKLRRRSSKAIEGGKIQLMLYSKEIAEKGIIVQTNEVFERDYSNPILAWVIIVDGSASELIHQAENLKDKPRPSTYITQLLERGVIGASTTETRVFRYDIDYYTPGIDNTAPFIKLTPNSVELKGTALFSSGKLVGTITTTQTGLLMSLSKTLKDKQYTYTASGIDDDINNPKHGLSILVKQKNKRTNVYIKNNIPVVDIYLDLYGYIDEYKWDSLNSEDEVNKLSEDIQGQMEKNCLDLIQYMQSIKSDPIGIGDIVRAKYNNYWKKVDWHEAYKNAIITPHVKFKIIQYGAIE